MKTNQTAGSCILGCLFAYLLAQIYYLSCYIMPFASGKDWEGIACLFLAQSVFFAACILAASIFFALRKRRQWFCSPFDSLLVVNGEGKVKREILLDNKRSFLITGKKDGREVFVESANPSDPDRRLYAVCNLAGGRWYLEASPGHPVGLKRVDGDIIYRLREGISYQLFKSDVIYAGNCKIVVRKQRNIWREQNGSDSL